MNPRHRRHRLALWLAPVLLLVFWSLPAAAQDSCTIGNLNDPAGPPAPDIFKANETYAYHVFPPEQCSCSEGGFIPTSVSQLLYFDTEQIPATFQVQAQLLAAVYDAGSGCYTPGVVICEGPPLQVTVTTTGVFQATAPFDLCPVQPFAEHYFLALKYTGYAPGYLVTDGLPQECTEYVDRGAGWEDMFFFPGKTGGGKSILFGDIVCDAYTVDNEQGAWGVIKSLYR